jgi:hypothetical protein
VGRWTKWKSEGCQGYERKEVAQLTPLALDAALQAAAAAPSNPNRVDTGSEALNRSALNRLHHTSLARALLVRTQWVRACVSLGSIRASLHR